MRASYFNPRSREGSDREQARRAYRNPYFNPRSREGSDVLAQPGVPVVGISIHAPVKGATAAPKADCRRSRYFNPRSREGSDMGHLAQA